MSQKYLISIDGGTQSTKVLIFDVQGNIVGEGRQVLRPMEAPYAGACEHPDDDLWDSLITASHAALSAFDGDPKDIVGVGLCTIRSCRCFLREDGSLSVPVISWMDPRSHGPYYFPTDDTRYATTTTGYMTHKMTGEFKDTVANCATWQWPADIATWDWTENTELMKMFHLTRNQLLELKKPGEILGYVTREAAAATGIPEGIPVVATANDKAVEALGAGLMQGNAGLVSLGTYSATMVKGPDWAENPVNYYTNYGCVPGQYLFESGGLQRGMWLISWFRDLFGKGLADEAAARGIAPETVLEEEARDIPVGSEGLLTIPEWLVASHIPEKYRKGAMVGFDVRHGRGHMYRSIMEGMTLTLYNYFDSMCRELNIAPDRLIVSGGGSKSDLFVRIIADVFGLPVELSAVKDAAGVGAAICTAVATGIYPDFDAASDAMVHIQETVRPNAENHAAYMQINQEVYRDMQKDIDPIMEKAYPLFNE